MNLLQQILGEELYNQLLELVGEDGIAEYLAKLTEESTDEEKEALVEEVKAIIEKGNTEEVETEEVKTDEVKTEEVKTDEEVDMSLYILKTESDKLIEEARQSSGASVIDGWLTDGQLDMSKVVDPDLKAYIQKEMDWLEEVKGSSAKYIKQYSILNEAIKQGAKDEWDVLQFVNLDDYELNEDGTIDATPIVEGIKTRKPYLFETVTNTTGGINPPVQNNTSYKAGMSFSEAAEIDSAQ